MVLSPSAAAADSPLPGVPLVVPSTVSTEVVQVINPGPVSGCLEEGYRGGKNKRTTTKKEQTHKSRQGRQGCKQLLPGGQRRSSKRGPDWLP